MGAPQPEEIYELTREEGKHRLERPFLEMASTALAAGLDIAMGVTVLTLLQAQLEHRLGTPAAHAVASVGFGIGFVFLIVGRGELFTENFLVPIAGLDHRRRSSWLALVRLWVTSPLFNIAGGLSVQQLADINFGAGTSAAQINLGGDFYEVGISAVPEPTTRAHRERPP